MSLQKPKIASFKGSFNPFLYMTFKVPYLPDRRKLFASVRLGHLNKRLADRIWLKAVKESVVVMDNYLKSNDFRHTFKYNHTGVEVLVPKLTDSPEDYLSNLETDLTKILNERLIIYREKSKWIKDILDRVRECESIKE